MEKTIPVKVAVRCRPLVSNEVLEGCQVSTRTVPNEQTIVLRGEKMFTFDYVFGEESSQAEVYEACVSSLLPRIFEGYNGTVLAYGQTGSGKTFTMGTSSSSNDTGCDDAGIIARIVDDIFKHITTSTEKIFPVRATFLEIYKENIFDLFSKSSFREPLTIREDHAGTIRVTNLTEVSVTTPEETIQLLENASASRSTASTNINLRSSRSHAIFTMIVEQRDKGDGVSTRLANFHTVDLAGSERAGKTKAVGERLKEGIKINRGLSSLGNVISALCDGDPHVPCRDSKLTRLLQDSSGGNSHTVMIACISPADSNLEETLSTLRYAGRARRIKSTPVVNFDPTQARIARLRQQTSCSIKTGMEKTIPVKVAVRCRPLVSNEVLEGCQVCTRTVPNEQTMVSRGEKMFKFDYVFGEESSQAEVYEACVSSLLPRIFEGYKATVLAYGQMGSGKTFTMGTRSSSNDTGCDDAGIIARIVDDIFQHITTSTEKIFLVRATFLEICKENIFDLFSKSSFREPLTIREDHAGTIRVTNLTEVSLTTPEETIQLLENASASQSTASTNINLRSSRSHEIFTMIVEQRDKGDGGSTRLAKFHIVDLAGSERAGKTKAVGERLKEGIKINRGHSSLGNVISALCDGDPHVPCRDSKLTRLLQDSLGWNSHTVMIACISPADSNLEETLSTLRYAGRARRIKNKPVVNFDPTQARITRLH